MIHELTTRQKQALNRAFFMTLRVEDKYEFNMKTSELWHELPDGTIVTSRPGNTIARYIIRKYVCDV